MYNNKITFSVRLKNLIFSPTTYLFFRLILGGIFIYSGSVKLMDIDRFAGIIYEYGILSDIFINPAAIGLPLIEIITGTGLIFNVKFSLELISLMLLMFIGILWFGILKDLNIDCGCFSSDDLIEQDSLKKALYRDFIFVAISVFLFISQRMNNLNRPSKLFTIRK